MKWYVLHVRTGRENDIKEEINRIGYLAVVPTEIVQENIAEFGRA